MIMTSANFGDEVIKIGVFQRIFGMVMENYAVITIFVVGRWLTPHFKAKIWLYNLQLPLLTSCKV